LFGRLAIFLLSFFFRLLLFVVVMAPNEALDHSLSYLAHLKQLLSPTPSSSSDESNNNKKDACVPTMAIFVPTLHDNQTANDFTDPNLPFKSSIESVFSVSLVLGSEIP
jgi:hypothetical protein